MKGSYILLTQLPKEQTISIGSLKALHFPRGYYAYVGSAMSGFKPRISRHLKSNKKLHWHIDYLLEKASITGIILGETIDRAECTIAQALSCQFDFVTGFGCSDCRCHSHLFFSANESQMKSTVMAILKSQGVRQRLVRINKYQSIAVKNAQLVIPTLSEIPSPL